VIAGYILLVEPVASSGYGLAVFLRLWNLTCTEVPRPGVEITSRSAPTSPARLRMYSRPRPGGGSLVSKPWPSSRTRTISTEPTRFQVHVVCV
jgi:hypothetical protein